MGVAVLEKCSTMWSVPADFRMVRRKSTPASPRGVASVGGVRSAFVFRTAWGLVLCGVSCREGADRGVVERPSGMRKRLWSSRYGLGGYVKIGELIRGREVDVAVSWQAMRKVAVPTAATAVVTSGLAVAVNVATDGGAVWAWVAVAVLTAAAFAASLWLQLAAQPPAPAAESVGGIDVEDAHAGKNMRFGKVSGPGVRVRGRRLEAGEDMTFDGTDSRGDASHP